MDNMLEEMRNTAAEVLLFVDAPGAHEHLDGDHRIGMILLKNDRETIIQCYLHHLGGDLGDNGHIYQHPHPPEP